MKTIKIMLTTFIVAIISSDMLVAQENKGTLLNMTEFTIKPGHNAQFREGVKKWKECYLENEGENNWNMWQRDQGEGTVYVMTGNMPNWAEMDKVDEKGKACYVTALNLIIPHIEKADNSVAQRMPDISRTFPDDAKYVRVTFYNVSNGNIFEEVINEVGKAIKDKEGTPRGMWYDSQLGGPKTADYFVSMPFKKYADLDISRDSPRKIYTDAVGQEKADEMVAKWYSTVWNTWSYTYTLESELSN